MWGNMDTKPQREDIESEKALDIWETNFTECLDHLHRYINITLIVSVVYLIIIFDPQRIVLAWFPAGVEGENAIALLGIIYISVGAMATYVAERANKIAGILVEHRPARFAALRSNPSIGTTTVPVVPFFVSFVPAAIFSLHLGYLGYKNSNGDVVFPIMFYMAVGITLWLLLPVGDSVVSKRNKTGK